MTKPAVYWLDGSTVECRCASEGVQFAFGLFETMRFDGGRLEQPQAHLDRLSAGLSRLGLNEMLTLPALQAAFEKARVASGMESGALKILALRRGSPVSEASVDVQLYLRPNPYKTEEHSGHEQSYTLGLSPYAKNSRSPVAGLKWQGYADHLLAKEQAVARGFTDALFLNESDFVAESAVANVFWITGGKLYAPSLDCGILPGIMRANVLTAAKSLGMTSVEGRFPLESLLEAECVFVTNSLMRLRCVERIEEKTWMRPSAASPASGMVQALRDAVRAIVVSD